ncbi:4-(cytidine 5'-diphospho)-2-C-methyl-D-erythritol kinase [Agitococcus lubricus]|uniref:4-diphosphocytidyl-2-C-methyl-D-erythritol kinase n=1 Tax=Agitococcus lubricus TaxID=1077255 RepID=A0A2T5ITM3_9GAMM|nr:4-(cytidine 5'-diphospho)-2-C-methyl-D-erythritol kinase [Agitococcus lubricus]PTQ87219.1 4-diphosphocytidyl-2-C-methyl-D-erythritol kinase [Agitococcus lubricus]
MVTRFSLPSPAKLNLMLRITGRRQDGYHNLQTIFQFLDYGDTLDFSWRDDSQIHLSPDLTDVPHEDNLIVKAARMLQQDSGCRFGVDIQLHKILPMGGGIGGGSSNAATTLLALNVLWDLTYSLTELAALGLRLGADVPIFIQGVSAWAEGVGEVLSPLQLPETAYLVITPDCKISTREIFSHPALTRDSVPIKLAASEAQGGRNDCESVVKALYPAVDDALCWLRQYGDGKLTGTGSCVFLACDSIQHAQTLLHVCPFAGFVATGQNISPTHQALALISKNSS